MPSAGLVPPTHVIPPAPKASPSTGPGPVGRAPRDAPLSPTTTTLAVAGGSGIVGGPMTFTATVSAFFLNPDGGTVTFMDGPTPLGSAPVVRGSATFTTSALGAGPHAITAAFGGIASEYLPSASGIGPASPIGTVAGTGTRGDSGDGGPAASARIGYAYDMAFDASGNAYIPDASGHVIRKVSPSGVISTFAGTGTAGNSGDGGPATSARIDQPLSLAFDASGNLYFTDYGSNVVRMVTPGGVISTVAGTGAPGSGGDGGPAAQAPLNGPQGLAVDASGNLDIAEDGNNDIRQVTPGGVISTIAGTGTDGSNGDGGLASFAQLSGPNGLATDAQGDLFVADYYNSRVREITVDGLIHTVAGTGTAGDSGDGGQATSAALSYPTGVAVDAQGDLFIADSGNNAVREVTPDGVIHTVAGTGTAAFSGDGGPAAQAALNDPEGLALDASGDLFVCDSSNYAIREVGAYVPVTIASSGPAVRLAVSDSVDGPSAGSTEVITVTALDAGGNVATADSDAVHLTSSDPRASLPPDARLVGGVATFAVTLRTAGPVSVFAADPTAPGVSGTDSGIAVTPGPATRLAVSANSSQVAGAGSTVTVTAFDGFGNVAAGYSGLVHLSSGDRQAALPADATLSGGSGTFVVGLRTAGLQSIAATSGGIGGTSSGILVTSAPASRIVVAAPSALGAGYTGTVAITALDPFGNVASGDNDWVNLAGSDRSAVLPGSVRMSGGMASFGVRFQAAGVRSFGGSDAANGALNFTRSGILVTSTVARFVIAGPAIGAVAGGAGAYTVTAVDGNGRVPVGYSGTVQLFSSDPSSNLPGLVTLANGVGNFAVTFERAGTQALAVNDPFTPTIAGYEGGIVVRPMATGTVYRDLNADGQPEPGEPGMAGRVVYLDLNRDGNPDPGDPTAVTDGLGRFAFPGSAAGSAPIREATARDVDTIDVVDQARANADGTVSIGVVPISTVVPVPVAPSPFGPGPAADPNSAYVQALYRAVLGRTAGSGEVAGWVASMASGTTRAQVAGLILNSTEHRAGEVAAYYREFLHRPADAGSNQWVRALQAGVSEAKVVEAILDTAEYQSAHQDPASLVRDLYSEVLGRQADPGGIADWVSRMASGLSRPQVVADFVESTEAVDAAVGSFYSAYLHRPAASIATDPFAAYLASPGGSATQVAIAFLSGAEFAQVVKQGGR